MPSDDPSVLSPSVPGLFSIYRKNLFFLLNTPKKRFQGLKRQLKVLKAAYDEVSQGRNVQRSAVVGFQSPSVGQGPAARETAAAQEAAAAAAAAAHEGASTQVGGSSVSFLRRLTNSHNYGPLLVGNEVDILEENFSEALDAEVNIVRQSRLLCCFDRNFAVALVVGWR